MCFIHKLGDVGVGERVLMQMNAKGKSSTHDNDHSDSTHTRMQADCCLLFTRILKRVDEINNIIRSAAEDWAPNITIPS